MKHRSVKVRRSWGVIKPATKVIASKRKQLLAKIAKQELRRES